MKNLLGWSVLINAALFQITWFACVIGSAKGLVWPAFASCAALAVYQLQGKRRHPSDVTLILASIGLGLIVDSIWVQSGWLIFSDQRPFSFLAPVWIIVLWVGFAMTINHSLAWLDRHPILPIAMGFIGGPMSYLAGLKLGAVEYQQSVLMVSAGLAVAWAISLLILVKIRIAYAKKQKQDEPL